jgi:tRNA nucleotidyltransferase/poly(A) polymerase
MSVQERVITWLAEQGLEAYLVGGSVRDRLLGRQGYDLDVVTPSRGTDLARRLANRFGGDYYALDDERGTGRAVLYTEAGKAFAVDVAQFRAADLRADLADRDFTINAMAADVRTPGLVIDPFGGREDIRARMIRPVSAASIRNDPVRALRSVRQALELGFSLAPETEALVERDGPSVSGASPERVRDELAKLLALPQSAWGLRCLDRLGLLAVVIPELELLRGVAQPPPHHLDVLSHSLEAVAALEVILDLLSGLEGVAHDAAGGWSDHNGALRTRLAPFSGRLTAHVSQPLGGGRARLVTLKLAVLLHDTGKPVTTSMGDGDRIRFLGHQEAGTKLTASVLRRLRLSNDEVRLAETIVLHHMRPLLLARQEAVSSRAVYRFFRDTGTAGVDVLLHALADRRAMAPPGTRDAAGELMPGEDDGPRLVGLVARMLGDYWERRPERVCPPRLVSGHDLLREFDLEPGPQIGELLEAVREAQVSGDVGSPEEALALVADRLSRSSS